MPYILEAACLCNTGKVRKNNEDNFYFDGRLLPVENDGLEEPITMKMPLGQRLCVAVFDGMGGENFGEIASFTAAERMRQEILSLTSGAVSERKALESMCGRLNAAVVAKQKELLTERMGSTLVSLLFSGAYVYACNLGDSRSYRLRDGDFLQLSEDHVEHREGQASKKAPLTQHLGIDPENYLIEPHIAKGELKAGDSYLLCSDGLTDMLSNCEITQIMSRTDSAEDCARQLVRAALDKGGRDNITVIVCRISGRNDTIGGGKAGADESVPGFLSPDASANKWSPALLNRKAEGNNARNADGKRPDKAFGWPMLLGSIAALVALFVIGFFTIHIWEPATCTEAEICRICGKTRTEALGHDWGEWTVVTAPTCTEAGLEQRICRADESHVETREIPATGHTWKDATCTEPSVCTVCGEESEGPIGHKWGEPTYTWSADNSEVTAKRTCENDSDHVETETASTTSEVTTPATCIEKGMTTYTAVFSNSAFSEQTKTVEDVSATGHKWGEPTYTWSADNSEVTAKRTCENDPSHIETETASTMSEVTTPATCIEKGMTTYAAVFSNSAFSEQTKTVEDVPATGHKWGEPTYTWSEDNSCCTAKRTCSVCGITEEETGNTTSEVTTPASCTEMGKTTYMAVFSNSAFSTQTKTVADIPATGHRWGTPRYAWSSDKSTVTATRSCFGCGIEETEIASTTSEVTVLPTCTEKGTRLFTSEPFENDAFSVQQKNDDIPALGHSFSEATCTEPEICERCGETGAPALGHVPWTSNHVDGNPDAAVSTDKVICKRCGQPIEPVPGEHDIRALDDRITYPEKDAYLLEYETMIVKSDGGYPIPVYHSPGVFRHHRYSLTDGTAVTVLAREDDMSCIIFTWHDGKEHAGWVYSAYLADE